MGVTADLLGMQALHGAPFVSSKLPQSSTRLAVSTGLLCHTGAHNIACWMQGKGAAATAQLSASIVAQAGAVINRVARARGPAHE